LFKEFIGGGNQMFHITVSERKGITHTVKFTRLLLETGERGIRFPVAVPTTGKNKRKRFPAFSAVAVNPDTGGLRRGRAVGPYPPTHTYFVDDDDVLSLKNASRIYQVETEKMSRRYGEVRQV